MTSDSSPKTASSPWTLSALEWLVKLWVPLCAGFYLWQVYAGWGIYTYLIEKEFAYFSRSFPAATFTLLVALTVLPPVIALLVWKRRRRKKEEKELGAVRRDAAILRRAHEFRTWMLVLMASFFCAALVVAVIKIIHGRNEKTPITLTAQGTVPEGLRNNPATLSGLAIHSRTVGFTRGVGEARYTVRFVPVSGGAGAAPAYRFLVQLPPQDRPVVLPDAEGRFSGVLVRNSLPGPVATLFNDRGIIISQPYYVLYTDREWNKSPEFLFAGELALAGIAAAILAYFQNRQLRARKPNPEEAVAT